LTRTQNKKVRLPAGMKKKMFGYMAAFIAIVLAVLWLFQVVLLDDIYIGTVKAEASGVARSVALATKHGADDLTTRVYDLAAGHATCISVFEIRDGVGRELVSAHSQNLCLIHSAMNEGLIGRIYSAACERETFVENIKGPENENGNIITAKLLTREDCDILVLVNTPLASVDATVQTLHFQLIFISFILLIIAAAMAYIIAGRVTRPVAAMNREAKKLAEGNYDVNFEGGEFLETAELGRTLNYAARELSKLDTMQKELISNISHDLRTPLTMISGYSEVMRDIPGEMTAENMQIIIDETKRLSSLVSDLLDLSRLTGGKRELKKSIFSLTECVRQTLSRYSHLVERDGYSITFESDTEVFVEADEILILQVIYNLVSNAINYTGEDRRVHISETVKNGVCRISVSDTGEGIPKEKLPYIWDRYYRTGDFHRRAVSGTGLGLSIVKNALILHHAPFGVSSTVGIGSTFWFELPVYAKDSLR